VFCWRSNGFREGISITAQVWLSCVASRSPPPIHTYADYGCAPSLKTIPVHCPPVDGRCSQAVLDFLPTTDVG